MKNSIKRKNTKNITILFAALITLSLLMLLAPQITPANAAGWAQKDGNWVYYEENGTIAKNTLKKSGDKLVYLGNEGTMKYDQIVEITDNGVKKMYYVDSNGFVVKNAWIQLAGPGGTYEYLMYYCTDDGTIYTDTLADIDGKQYYFNQSGFLELDARFTYNGKEYSAARDGVVTLMGAAEKSGEEYGQEELMVKESSMEGNEGEGIVEEGAAVPSLWRRFLEFLGF